MTACVVWFQHSLGEGQFWLCSKGPPPILCPYSGLPVLNTAISKGQGRELSNTTCVTSHFTTHACIRSLSIGLFNICSECLFASVTGKLGQRLRLGRWYTLECGISATISVNLHVATGNEMAPRLGKASSLCSHIRCH